MTDAEAMLQDCNRLHRKLNDWEQGFIDSLNQLTDVGNISYKQYETLERIWERIT